MSQRYFQNLPNIYYNNVLCKDISRRAKLVEDPRHSPFVFYPYELKHQLRSDQVAEYYYQDSYLDWMIYMSNGIIDPYYGWYLDDYKMEQLLIEKYGSVEKSMKLIKHFINNWADDSNEIDAAFYNNTLQLTWKKYYTPSVWKKSSTRTTNQSGIDGLVYNNNIVTYKRAQHDFTVNTNRILDYTISANNGLIGFSNGELIDICVTPTSTVGTAQVITANSTVVRVQSVQGNTSANSTFTKFLIGETTGANVSANNVTTRKQNVTVDEEVFWSPVSFYDYEVEINEQRKNIILASAGVKDLLIQNFQQRLQEDMDPVTRLGLTE